MAGGGHSESGWKSSQGGHGNPEEASPAAIQRFLKGMDYPAPKKTLVEHAREHDAPQDVLNVLGRLEERTYGSAADVSKAIGDVE
jgi:hypothetical protein